MIRMEYRSSADQVPAALWERFVPGKAVGLEINHLRAVEFSGINDIHPYYLIGYDGEKPVGIAYCFSIRVDLAGMTSSYPREVINTIKTWFPGFMEIRIVEVGHIASLGPTIEVLPAENKDFLLALSEKIDEIAALENADLCMIRDISNSSLPEFNILEKLGFQTVRGFPIARMELTWNSFEGYLASLKSRKRNNILKKRAKLHAPEINVEIIENYAPYSVRLAELWENVARQNNGYEHEKLTPAFFESMAANLNGQSHVVAIKRHGEIIAYGLNLIGDNEYFGVAEGLDYGFRDRYDLYANNIFEGLRVACELKKKTFNIGITAYEFKTSIGAYLDPCLYFIKAIKNPDYTAVYSDFFKNLIKQTDKTHRAFREGIGTGRSGSTADSGISDSGNDPPDPFAKHIGYIRIDTVRSIGLYTFCPEFEGTQGPVIRHKGRDIIMFGTNSYLGIAGHPKVKAAMHAAIEKYGSGCSGSPLLNGTLDIHNRLSRKLAEFIGKESALVFSTGYQTNVGAISALVNRDDILIMDRRNHASLVDGALLSGAAIARYKHNDVGSLEEVLERYSGRFKLIVTDSLFSMEGTVIDLPAIVRLAQKYHARLMLDESHAIGVLGPNGRGVAEHYGLTDEIDIIMGTFSKSLASIGGFIAGGRKIIDTLRHTSRAHIFSASLPPAAVAAVLTAVEIIENEPERRERLLENAKFLANGLRELGYQTAHHDSAIISIFCGHELLAAAAFRRLFEEGIFVNPVTSPAVPKHQEMLRVSLMATHDQVMIEQALAVFKRIRTADWPACSV
ncbi:MAG: aminotransferase class I/II-fold pyridoxal phosphate-dependent enzyme [Spirochaetales bacterium]|nr:aminotransferase class I/II-fold pyridoxal phosphate-dependent enzyme [Spirochaetales bacterium]